MTRHKSARINAVLLHPAFFRKWGMNYLTQGWRQYPAITSPSPLQPSLFLVPVTQLQVRSSLSTHRLASALPQHLSATCQLAPDVFYICTKSAGDVSTAGHQQPPVHNQPGDSDTALEVLTPMSLLSTERKRDTNASTQSQT